MKKKLIYSLIIISILLCTLNYSALASTNTYTRPSDSLGIKNDIEITSVRETTIKKTPYVDATEKIYDFADLFTDDEEVELYNKIKTFIENTNIDMVIVTINENNKYSSMDYADDFYDYNDFGIGDNNNGILFLIDMHYRKMWISTTGDAIKIYNSKIDSILDKCYTYISDKNYNKTALTFIESTQNAYDSHTRNKWITGVILVLSVSLLIPTIFCLVIKLKHKKVKLAKDANLYLIKSSIKTTDSYDRFSHSHTSRTRKSSSSSSGGGSHSRKQWKKSWWWWQKFLNSCYHFSIYTPVHLLGPLIFLLLQALYYLLFFHLQ